MITSPQNTRFIQSTVSPLGPLPDNVDGYLGGLGAPFNNDYYPVANGPVQSSMSSDEIRYVRCVEMLWQYEDQVFAPIMSKLLAAWAQYNNLYDSDADKDEWQSKKATPFMFITLERLAGAFVQFIEQRPGWFQGEASVPPMQMFVDLMTKFLGWWLQHPLVDFFSSFEEAMKQGIMTGHIHMTITMEREGITQLGTDSLDTDTEKLNFTDELWSQISPFLQNAQGGMADMDSSEYPFIASPSMPRLCFTLIPTAAVRLDSTGRERYKIWKTIMGIGEFIQTAGARGWNMQACQDCIGSHSQYFDRYMNYTALQQGVKRTQENVMHTVELTHFEGNLHDPQTGQPLFQKSYMVVANGRTIVYGPSPIPFWDGHSIMVSAPFVKNPNAVYGKSFLPESVDMMDVRHDLQNVLIDYIRKVLQPPLQIDKSLLAERQFADGDFAMYPNRMITIRSNGAPGAQAITPVMTPDLPVGFWQFLQYFQQNQQESTGMNQELMGSPATRLRQTGMEQDARKAEAGKFLEAIWSGIERRFLTPVLRISALRLLQYISDEMWGAWVLGMKSNILPGPKTPTDPATTAWWSDQLDKCATWDARTRYRYFGGFFSWKVSIFNNLSQRQSEIEKITMLMNVGSKIEGFFQALNLKFWIEKLVVAFGWDPSEGLNLDQLPAPNQNALDALDPQSAVNKILGQAGVPGGNLTSSPNMPNTDGGGLAAFLANMQAGQQQPIKPGNSFPGGPVGTGAGPIPSIPGSGGAP